MRQIILVLIHFIFLPSFAFPQSDVVFRRNGAGLWLEQGEKTELVVVVEMRRKRDDQLTITIRPINGIPRRFAGTVSDRDRLSYSVRITSSGKQEASGTIYVENDATASMRFIMGSGDIDGRKFAFHFTKERPLRWNEIALGGGTLAWGEHNIGIQAASVLITMKGSADVSFMADDGSVKRWRAVVPPTTGNTQSTTVELSLPSEEASSGGITIERNRAKYRLETMVGAGRVNGEEFAFKFRADATVR